MHDENIICLFLNANFKEILTNIFRRKGKGTNLMPVSVVWSQISNAATANTKIPIYTNRSTNTSQNLSVSGKITEIGKRTKSTSHVKRKESVELVGVLNNTIPDLKSFDTLEKL